LEERWQQIQQHKQQCILIQGTAGIGKTALVHAFMAAVCEQQGSAIYARTSPATHPPAYGPVIDWLRSGLFTAQLRALQQIWQAEIAALLPELQEGLANLHIHLGTATAGHYSHLQDALCALLQQVQQPLLLVLDDLQWCDMATLDWLQRLLTGPVALPILLIATARTDELYDTPAITLWSLRLREAQRLHEIELPLLDERQSATLTNLLLETKRPGDRIAPVTAAEVYRVTEGHPQMIEELLSLLPQQPVHRRYHVLPQVIPTESTPNAPLALPKADAAIAVRLAQRSPAAQTVVGMAACIGPSVTLAQLLAVADENVHTLLDALDELLATGILYEGLNGTYAFVHGRVRQVARMQLSQARGRYYQQRLQQAVRYS
jgi:predicted ATPase